jgi:phosphatidylglycerophosphate synthase
MSVISGSLRARVRNNIERPVAAVFTKTGLSPNALTVIGFGIAVIGAYLAATQSWLIAGLVVAFGAVFDLFDGALARATNRVSKLGGFLDSVFDRAGEAVVYVGCAWACLSFDYDLGAILACAAMATSFMVSYTRAKSESLGFASGTGMANVGLAPREVRTAILVVTLLAAGALGVTQVVFCVIGPCPPLLQQGAYVLAGGLALITLLAALTTLQRIYFVYRQSEPKQQEVQK